MSAAACKIIINDDTGDAIRLFKGAVRRYHALLDLEGGDNLDDHWYDEAVDIDKEISRQLREAVKSYNALNSRLAQSI